MKTLGASLELVEPGRVHIAVPFSPAFTQQHRYVHAGVINSIADSACGYAAMTLAPSESEVSRSNSKSACLHPRTGGVSWRWDRCYELEKGFRFAPGEVHAISESGKELIAKHAVYHHHQTI